MLLLSFAACQVDNLAPFTLTDINSTSPTFMTDVSTSDYVGTTTAWYFGHAT